MERLEDSPAPARTMGARDAGDELVARVYAELRALAAGFLRRERPGHTLQATAVVHEAYLRLARHERGRFEDHVHVRAIASLVIRRLLADHARRSLADRRGAAWTRVTLGEGAVRRELEPATLLAIDEALERLRARDERQARVVELRYFGGLSIDEAAEVLGVSPSTVDADWRMARAWLRRELDGDA